MMASFSRCPVRAGVLSRAAGRRGEREGKERIATAVFLQGALEVIAYRLGDQSADTPNGKGNQRDDPGGPPPPRIERLLRQARRHKAGDVDLLAVGVRTRPVKRRQRVLVSGFGEFPVALQLFVSRQGARQRIALAAVAAASCQVLRDRVV